jgi:prevent-host-death family protein
MLYAFLSKLAGNLPSQTTIAYFGHNGQNSPNGSPVNAMKSMSAKDAKNAFGLLLDTARAEPVTIEKYGRRVAVVLSVEKYERLRKERTKTLGSERTIAAPKKGRG